MQRIFLVGPRGSGKTTVGLMLARRLQASFWDTDLLLEESIGMTIAEFVARQGWDRFRDEEHNTLACVSGLGGDKAYAVVSTGGGVVLREDNRELLRSRGTAFYLSVPAPVLAARLARAPNQDQRPSLTGRGLIEEVEEILAARESLYRQTAHHVIPADKPQAQICDDIEHLLGVHWNGQGCESKA